MFDELYAAKVEYSSVAKWSAGNYLEGDLVQFDGVYYKANSGTNQQPGGTAWNLADKFSSACMNELWCEYLGPYLALLVIRKTIPGINLEMSGQGMVKKFGRDFQAADHNDVIRYQKYIDQTVKERYQLLEYYLRKQTCVTYTKRCQQCGNDKCVCRKTKHRYQVA